MKTFADFGITLPHGASGEVDVPCPQCSPSRRKKQAKCLSVNVEKGCWSCAHCGWVGGLMQGARHVEEPWRKPIYVRPIEHALPEQLEPAMLEWFKARGIPEHVLRRNRISMRSVYMPQVESRVQAIAFPYYRGAELINIKYRDREKNFRMEVGAERILYGLNDIDPARVVIVEGEIDRISVEVAGIVSCVSVPDGAPAINTKNYETKFTFLDCDEVAAVREWIIAVDNDEPGTRLEQELLRRFGVENCRRVTWPDGCKDANDVLIRHGADALRTCIESAALLPIAGAIRISELRREIELLYAEGEGRGLSTGWLGFDEFYSVAPGTMTVITGVPGSGKSNWLDALLVNLARLHGWIAAMFSPENQPLRQHAARLMEKFTGQPFRPGPTQRMSPQRRDEALAWVDHHFHLIAPEDDADWTLDRVLSIAAALVRRHGVKVVALDPFNELEHTRPPQQTETEFIGACLKRIRQFARRHQVAFFVVAHPAKMLRDKKTGEVPVPSLYDIHGSAHWFNKSDNGLVVWRDKGDPKAPVIVHVQKVRFREHGRLGAQPFRYGRAIGDYEELSGPKSSASSVRDARLPPEKDEPQEVLEL